MRVLILFLLIVNVNSKKDEKKQNQLKKGLKMYQSVKSSIQSTETILRSTEISVTTKAPSTIDKLQNFIESVQNSILNPIAFSG